MMPGLYILQYAKRLKHQIVKYQAVDLAVIELWDTLKALVVVIPDQHCMVRYRMLKNT